MKDKYNKLHKKIAKRTGYSVRLIEAVRTQILGGGINPEDLKEFWTEIMSRSAHNRKKSRESYANLLIELQNFRFKDLPIVLQSL